MTGSAS
jgi:hypothetical protein